jgi:hypothetical protein
LSADDAELRNHLAGCESCAKAAEASGILLNLLAAAAVDDSEAMPSLEFQRTRVQERLARGRQRLAVSPGRWAGRHKPALISGLAVVAACLALSLIPFTSYITVGYDLKLAGVDRDLATDDEIMCGILHGLGLVEASVDVEGCDTTCKLSILDLKSEREAFLVVGAVSTRNGFDLTSDITPIRAPRSASFWQQAHRILRGGDS